MVTLPPALRVTGMTTHGMDVPCAVELTRCDQATKVLSFLVRLQAPCEVPPWPPLPFCWV